QPLQRPALCQLAGNQAVNLTQPLVDAGHDIVEETDFGLMILVVVKHRAKTVIVEFVEELRHRRALHVPLVQCLDGGKPRRRPRRRARLFDLIQAKRSLSASMAIAARAAPPPLSPSSGRARTSACASFSTVRMPLPMAMPSMVSAMM